MSTTRKARLAALVVVSAAALALPLGLAAPADAATTKDGCTVTPLEPEFRETFTAGNRPEVFYPVEVSCVASATGLEVELDLQTWEQDILGLAGDVDANGVVNEDEDRIGSGSASRVFGTGGGSTTVDFKGQLPHTDTDFDEEVYGKVRFRVTSGPVTGRWTAFEFSPVSAPPIGW